MYSIECSKSTYDEENVPSPADAGVVIESNRGGLANHGVEGEGDHTGDGDTLGSGLGVEDLSGDNPGQRAAGGAEGEVVQPGHSDKAPACTTAGLFTARRELGEKDSSNDESERVEKVTADQGLSATSLVDNKHADELSDKSETGRDGLVLERVVARDTNLLVDSNRVVLNSADTSHLDGGLDGTSETKTSEAGLVGEELLVALGSSVMLDRDALLDLVKLGTDPSIVGVAVGVKTGKSLETLLDASVVDQPSRRLGEEEDESAEEDGGDTLDAE